MEAEAEADDELCCEDCEAILTDAEIEIDDTLCAACHAKRYFTCSDCGEVIGVDDRSEKCKARCCDCQDTLDEEIAQERLDASKEAAQQALDAILDSDDLDVIRKAVAALKRLQPPTTPNPEGTAS